MAEARENIADKLEYAIDANEPILAALFVIRNGRVHIEWETHEFPITDFHTCVRMLRRALAGEEDRIYEAEDDGI